ncbi:torsin-1A-like [Gigantopelta aegis]|uniref:torsin-1A-like n=1 Tax=Gigantopelta aegis TaxID=1735272 RepID=UPI001B88A649|nr:torsin-1A-like [Gigantopelta aegis]
MKIMKSSPILVTGLLSMGIQLVLSRGFFNSFYYMASNLFQHEYCHDPWILSNLTGLTPSMEKHVYGQHLVMKAVITHIKGHVRSPAKALALSFHGGTGTGKNHVSSLIAQHLYKEGMKSKFVHFISSTRDFPHETMLPVYKDQLRSWIEGNVSACPHSLFIFDEMDKMPVGLIDTIKPYLDYYDNLGGVDYKKAMFFFLSNTAGQDITDLTLKHWNDGTKREDIKLVDMERIIIQSAVNTKSGLWHSNLITKHLITAFIPFLFLTRKHVIECIKDDCRKKHYFISEDLINNVMEEMRFYPEDTYAFSVYGCKRVSEKVDYVYMYN